MKALLIHLAFLVMILPLSAQSNASRLAPGAENLLADLLGKPAMVSPAAAVPLGRNWFRLETDAHVFTDEVRVSQIAEALLDFDNMEAFFGGRRSGVTGSIIGHESGEITMDIVAISRGPLGIQIRTPHRAVIRASENTGSRFTLEIRQPADDSESNRNLRELYATRHAQEVVINGRRYTYIRVYTTNEVNARVLPNARSILERNAFPVVEELLFMIIEAAKTKR